jgi:tRNA threonylcarbamoyladenosine modification (KEOPS) complex Cgi121 subunit
MIVKDFYISDLDLMYSIGINQIHSELKISLDFLFNLIEKIQNDTNSMVQFFSDKYILNQEHLFTACYYVQKAFFNKVNISKRKNIEFLLYLASKRQIKNAIEAFGINNLGLESGEMSYIIVSNENNLNKINDEILQNLKANEIEITLNNKNAEKFNQIKSYFEISNNQINAVLNSYGVKNFSNKLIANNLDNLFLALNDLICEKMAILSLEKIRVD